MLALYAMLESLLIVWFGLALGGSILARFVFHPRKMAMATVAALHASVLGSCMLVIFYAGQLATGVVNPFTILLTCAWLWIAYRDLKVLGYL